MTCPEDPLFIQFRLKVKWGMFGQYKLLKEIIYIKLTLNSKIPLKFATHVDIKALEFISFSVVYMSYPQTKTI